MEAVLRSSFWWALFIAAWTAFGSPDAGKTCLTLSKGPTLGIGDKILRKRVEEILACLNLGDASCIEPMLHKKLFDKQPSARLMINLKKSYRKPWNFGIARVWSLPNPLKSKIIVDCDPRVRVTTLYGYEQQAGLWVQLLAEPQLARVYFALFKADSAWKIGGIHLQQWTYMQKDAESWYAQGLAAKTRGEQYMSFDISQKLLFGGAFLDFPVKEAIIKKRNEAYSPSELIDWFSQLVPNQKIVYVGTSIASETAVWLIRLSFPEGLAQKTVWNHCQGALASLRKAGVVGKEGIYCSGTVQGADPQKTGTYGGNYYR